MKFDFPLPTFYFLLSTFYFYKLLIRPERALDISNKLFNNELNSDSDK